MLTVDFRLYLVTDRTQTRERSLVSLLRLAGDAGLPAVQVRERDLSASDLCELVTAIQQVAGTRRPKVIVNDRLDIVLAAGADGVHLRADSLPVSAARRLLGPGKLLGVSTHSLDDVRRAEVEGADFVVFGPVYDTPSKRRYGAPLGVEKLAEAASLARVPVFAIGGVTPTRVAEIRRAGAFGVAVMSALLSSDDIARDTRAFLHELTRDAR